MSDTNEWLCNECGRITSPQSAVVCQQCGGLCFCSHAHALSALSTDSQHTASGECVRMQRQMHRWQQHSAEIADGLLPAVQRQHSLESECALLQRHGVHGSGPFAAECSCALARWQMLEPMVHNDNAEDPSWRNNQEDRMQLPFTSWRRIYTAKRLQMSSPAALALYSQLTIISLALNYSADFVHVLGAHKEAYQPESWIEAGRLLRTYCFSPSSEAHLVVHLIGPQIKPRSSCARIIAQTNALSVYAHSVRYEQANLQQQQSLLARLLVIALDAGVGGDASAWTPALDTAMMSNTYCSIVVTDITEEAASRACSARGATGHALELNAIRKPVSEPGALLPSFRCGFILRLRDCR